MTRWILALALALGLSSSAYASTSSTSASRVELDLHASLAVIHGDGSYGSGLDGCVAYRLNWAVSPEVCLTAEIGARVPGTWAGHIGWAVGAEINALRLVLPLTPSVGLGWAMLRIGPGSALDTSKSAVQIVASVPLPL